MEVTLDENKEETVEEPSEATENTEAVENSAPKLESNMDRDSEDRPKVVFSDGGSVHGVHAEAHVLCPATIAALENAAKTYQLINSDPFWDGSYDRVEQWHDIAIGHQIMCREATWPYPDYAAAIQMVMDKADELGAPFPYRLVGGQEAQGRDLVAEGIITHKGPGNEDEDERSTEDMPSEEVIKELDRIFGKLGFEIVNLGADEPKIDIDPRTVPPKWDGSNGAATVYEQDLTEEEIAWTKQPVTEVEPDEEANSLRKICIDAITLGEEKAQHNNLPPICAVKFAMESINTHSPSMVIAIAKALKERGYYGLPVRTAAYALSSSRGF